MKRKIFAMLTVFLGVNCLIFAQKIEAENGDLHGVTVEEKVSGFTGTGYGEMTNSIQKVSFTVETKDGDYGFVIRYANQSDEKELAVVKIDVDKKYVVSQRLRPSSKFVEVNSNDVAHLTKGEHIVTVTPLYDGYWLFDSIELVKITDSNKKDFTPSNKLSNKDPSPEAQKVFDYLVSMHGKGILSGQQIYGSNNAEIKVLSTETGKYPAVMGIDLIDFSPTRVSHGANAGRLVSNAKKYWQEGGIISCCWHWNAPANLLDKDEPNKHWYDGFRTGASTFDFKNGIFNPDSKEYKQMINDIDAIAKPLKQLHDANVPVLWRPIHEASGGWFWWGAAGKDAYLELYKVLYERLVNYHGLNNLIWVWNAQDPSWYPGDEYVDVIAYDYYPSPRKYGNPEIELQKIQSACYEPKLCALSENGTLPNIVKLAENKAPWSWFCTWNGDFTVEGGKYSEKYTEKASLLRFMEEDWYITRDELPKFIEEQQ